MHYALNLIKNQSSLEELKIVSYYDTIVWYTVMATLNSLAYLICRAQAIIKDLNYYHFRHGIMINKFENQYSKGNGFEVPN